MCLTLSPSVKIWSVMSRPFFGAHLARVNVDLLANHAAPLFAAPRPTWHVTLSVERAAALDQVPVPVEVSAGAETRDPRSARRATLRVDAKCKLSCKSSGLRE